MRKVLLLVFTVSSLVTYGQLIDLNLMPWPQEVATVNNKFEINQDFTIAVNDKTNRRIEIATTRFLRHLSGRTGVFIDKGFAFNISENTYPYLRISYQRKGALEINEDESYSLSVSRNQITITSITDIGVIYALETLLQLVSNDENSYFIPEVEIKDKPRFTWRELWCVMNVEPK